MVKSHSGIRHTAAVNMLKAALWDSHRGGRVDISDVIDAVQPRLSDIAAVLPIFQDTTIVAAGPSVQIGGLTRGAGRHCGQRRGRRVKTPQRVCT